jgi:hypothetical protein
MEKGPSFMKELKVIFPDNMKRAPDKLMEYPVISLWNIPI